MSQTMPRKLPLYVNKEKSRHGRITFYFRRGKGPRVRLPDDLQSDEFAQAYAAALANKPLIKIDKGAKTNSLQWLVERYMESGKWSGLSAGTRRAREIHFLAAIERGNNPPYAAITRRTLLNAMDARKATPFAANNFLKAMSGLFKWALLHEYIDTDPTIGVPRYKTKTDGFTPWTWTDLEKFCQKWPVGTKPRLAMELYLVTGLRRSDVHRVSKQHIRGNTLTIRALKPPHHPITSVLPSFLLETIAATPTGDLVLITNDRGEPFKSKESFGNWFGKRCREAGLEKGKVAHGIRKFSATVAAEGGATTHELMAQFGWSNPDQAEVYTRKADRTALGIRSSARNSEHFGNKLPRTFETGKGIKPKN